MGIAAVSINYNKGIEIVIYPQGEWDTIDFNASTYDEATKLIVYKKKEAASKVDLSKIDIAISVDGQKILRLRETVTYTCRIKDIKQEDLNQICHNLVFPNEKNNKFLNVTRDVDTLSFRYINYLGRTNLKTTNNEAVVDFEIVPQKMHYEDDYIELTKKIAEECAEILLEYAGVTSNRFESSVDNYAKTLLEQFIFLREFCYSHNLHALFLQIKRNPDRMLVNDEVLKPIGRGAPSASFYSSPFSNSRGWQMVNASRGNSNKKI